MPYIEQARRKALINGAAPQDVGELNYIITGIILEFLTRRGVQYKTMNDILGVLDAVAREFDRRVVADYEKLKREENGDVYPPVV